jgi:arylsulfatase A-like enzyme
MIKQGGKNREKLLSLEKKGEYVFHGSPDDIAVLEPRQAYNKNKKTGNMEKDGEPAVFATPYADIAIFRALINAREVKGESASKFGINDNKLHFSATKNLLEAAKRKIGKVYILDKQKFQNFEEMQCRSTRTNKPIEVVEVTADDLPNDIEILKN